MTNDVINFTSEADALIIFKQPDHPDWIFAYVHLLEHGSETTKSMMMEASDLALQDTFGAGFKPTAYAENGEQIIRLSELAKAVGVSVDDLYEKALEVEKATGLKFFYDEDELHSVQ